ncbi:MAG: hypothetical protein DRI36_06450 [Caldiserica bacterium]|nr:MAG: hypothetical protein DRI36_06450 [Caldisericota bacterium]
MKKEVLISFLLLLFGCAVGINYLMVSPNISRYSPGGLVILPTRSGREGTEAYTSLINSRFTEKLEKTGIFKKVVSPDRVIVAMESDEKIMDAVTKLFTRYQVVGKMDKKALKVISDYFGVDQIILIRLTNWRVDRVRTYRYTTVGIALVMVDKSGEILWKAQHTIKRKRYALFTKERTQFKQTTDTVINEIMSTIPFKKRQLREEDGTSEEELEKLNEIDKKELMRQHFMKATKLYQEGRYEEAIEEWEKVLEIDPNHELSKKKIEKAKKMLNK